MERLVSICSIVCMMHDKYPPQLADFIRPRIAPGQLPPFRVTSRPFARGISSCIVNLLGEESLEVTACRQKSFWVVESHYRSHRESTNDIISRCTEVNGVPESHWESSGVAKKFLGASRSRWEFLQLLGVAYPLVKPNNSENRSNFHIVNIH